MLTHEQILEIARAHCFYPDSDLTALVRTIEKAAEAAAIERCAKTVKALHERISDPITIGEERANGGHNALDAAERAILALLPKEE